MFQPLSFSLLAAISPSNFRVRSSLVRVSFSISVASLPDSFFALSTSLVRSFLTWASSLAFSFSTSTSALSLSLAACSLSTDFLASSSCLIASDLLRLSASSELNAWVFITVSSWRFRLRSVTSTEIDSWDLSRSARDCRSPWSTFWTPSRLFFNPSRSVVRTLMDSLNFDISSIFFARTDSAVFAAALASSFNCFSLLSRSFVPASSSPSAFTCASRRVRSSTTSLESSAI